MPRSDQPSIYLKDMYKVAFETRDKAKQRVDMVYSMPKGKVSGAGDKQTQLLGLGDMTRHEVEGQNITFRRPAEGWPFYVKYHTYSDGLILDFEQKEDSIKVKDLLKRMARTWEESAIDAEETLGSRVFNEGGTLSGDFIFNGTHQGQADPSGDLMYDSVPYFALSGNEYTKKDGSTYYNSVAGLSLDADNFETIYNLHTATNAYNELGRPIQDAVDTLLTQRGADYLMAKRILKTTEGLPGTAINDMNVYAGLADPIDWAYLSDSAFYVGKRQSPDMEFHRRMANSFDYFEDRNNRGAKASVMKRIGIFLKGRPFSRGGGSSSA